MLVHTTPTIAEDRAEIVTTTVFTDLFGRGVLRAAITEPRSMVVRGEAAMRTATASTAWLALAIMALLLLVLNRLAVVPLNGLTAHVARVGATDDLDARLNLRRGDEIGVLARSFDLMTDRLVDARRSLLERSFDAGKAELASGVLHNVGNVITPLVVRLVDLQERVRRAPAADVRTAVDELAANGGDGDRARDLRVHAELREEGGRALVHLRFEDDGIGLEGDELARVFERGFSTKARAGSGRGLHWCAITVQALGGTMRIESTGRNQGACMHLDLPLWPIAEAAHGGRA